jgi:hypothetical protein
VKSPKLGLSREESPNFAAPTMFQFEVSQMSDFWLDKFQYEVYNPSSLHIFRGFFVAKNQKILENKTKYKY